ncbi:MAG TPA: molybdopterin-binding protein [Egibacteraceae bacterium]|nr:molybdopterin-binding protein [Egibacteraceae bacterium]
MVERLRVSVVVIGDEILGGFVQDTNSHWLAVRLHELGVPLERVSTVPDQLDAIREALLTELGRARPRLVLTCGGIGSTPDDLTMEAVARSLGLGLERQPDIDDRITVALEWTARQGVDVTAEHERSMRKMAMVPEGAYLLSGAQGVAPGVALDVDGGCKAAGGATIVILPGVPAELKRIMEHGIQPLLLEGRGEPLHVAELRHPYPESTLNPVLERIVAEYPDVHLGSYPGQECIIRLKGAPERVEAAMALVRAHVEALAADAGAQRLREAWQERWSGDSPRPAS